MSSSGPSRKPLAPISLSLLLCVTLGLQACATRPTSPRTEVPASLKAKCERPAGAEDVRTDGELATYSTLQDAALQVCDARRDALVRIIEAGQSAVGPRSR